MEHKPFPAAVYGSGAALAAANNAIPEAVPVLMSEPVRWDVEVRCFVHDDMIATLSPYMRDGRSAQMDDGSWPLSPEEREHAEAFGTALLNDPQVPLPPAVALDVGHIAGRGWAVIEINSAWGAGIYGCDAAAVLPVLARGSVPRTRLTAADVRLLVL